MKCGLDLATSVRTKPHLEVVARLAGGSAEEVVRGIKGGLGRQAGVGREGGGKLCT